MALQYNDVVAAQTAAPPKYDSTGMLIPPTTPTVNQPSPGLSYNAAVAGQTANPPQYDATGTLINPSLAGIKTDLNNFQNTTFNDSSPSAPSRQSSALDQSVTAPQSQSEAAYQSYQHLVKQYEALPKTDLYDQYTQLVNQQGIPDLQNQEANITAQRNDLPYTNRAASGNAGVETEGQLSADTANKDVPLGVQEQNLINRLQLAQNFVNTAVNLKGQDAGAASDALSKALELASNGVTMANNKVSTLTAQQQQAQQQSNDTLNSILTLTKGQTWDSLDSQTQSVITNAVANTGLTLGAVKQAMASSSAAPNTDASLVQNLLEKYPDAGIMPTDTYAQAAAKLSNSKIYQGQVRPPASAGSTITDDEAHIAAFNNYDQIFVQGSKKDNLVSIGGDGYAKPSVYNTLRSDAISKGYSATSFDQQFASYVNPADPQDYNGAGGANTKKK
jgi:hypothetical protein